MIYRGDNGVKLIFNVTDNNGEAAELGNKAVQLQMVCGNTRLKKICSINREVKGQCFCVLDRSDTLVAGSYKYQLTVYDGASIFSSSSGKLKILNKV